MFADFRSHDGRHDDMKDRKRTKCFQMLLVSLAFVNLILEAFCFYYLPLKSGNPARAILGFLDLEGMLLSVGFEEKLFFAFLEYRCGIALKKCESRTRAGGTLGTLTRLMMPAGDDLSSARFAKKRRPLPVSWAQAALGCAVLRSLLRM